MRKRNFILEQKQRTLQSFHPLKISCEEKKGEAWPIEAEVYRSHLRKLWGREVSLEEAMSAMINDSIARCIRAGFLKG
jgi:hypothetical protein